MKKTILFPLLGIMYAFLYISCDNENESIKKSTILTRAVNNPVRSFVGEMEPLVGTRQTYRVTLSSGVSESTRIRIRASSDAILIAYGNTYLREHVIEITPYNNQLVFHALIAKPDNNIFISLSTVSGEFLVYNSDRISSKSPAIAINAPSSILPNTEFEVSANHTDVPNLSKGYEWTHGNFLKIRDQWKDGSQIKMKLKSQNEIGTYNIGLNVYGGYNQNGSRITIGSATHTIKVVDPLTLEHRVDASSCNNKVFNMPYLHMAPGAIISWQAGEKLSLISGQGTSTATYGNPNNYQGYTTVSATIMHNGTTKNIASEEIWVGEPRIIDNGQNDNLSIFDRGHQAHIEVDVNGSNEPVVWKLLSGNATLNPRTDLNGKHYLSIRSTAPINIAETIRVSLEVSNKCGTTSKIYEIEVQAFPVDKTDTWYVLNPRLNGNILTYYLVYKSTTNYVLSEMHIFCLYNGSYDGGLASVRWEWGVNGNPDLPSFASSYGTKNTIINGDSRIRINIGEIYVLQQSHIIGYGKTLNDLEYYILFIKDNHKNKFTDTVDFVY